MDQNPDPIAAAAQSSLGITYLYPYQRLVIANTLEADAENRYQIVVLPTGSGKTLCFIVPALLLRGTTLIVYPLLALMDDQLRRITSSGLRARILRGGQTPEERESVLRDVENGEVDCLLANPEVLAGAAVRRRLGAAKIAHMVVDEAHCVSEWGETFRPSYLTLRETINVLEPRVVTAFTATASPVVLEALSSILFGDQRPHLVQGDPDRPNIGYSVVHTHSKEAALTELVTNGIELPAIVFCRSRKRVEGVARDLVDVIGFERCSAYHAGLTKPERAAIEEWFFGSTDGVLAATCAYGMGVDKPNIRTVIHYELPTSVEAFLQESGRAGRDRLRARSVVLWNALDRTRETEPVRLAREKTMLGYLHTAGCRRDYLMRALGAESSACFSCDACTPEDEPPALRTTREALDRTRRRAIAFVSRHRRRLTTGDAVERLPVDWRESARRELLATLVATGRLTRLRHGPWRHRLSVPRGHRRTAGPD